MKYYRLYHRTGPMSGTFFQIIAHHAEEACTLGSIFGGDYHIVETCEPYTTLDYRFYEYMGDIKYVPA